MSWGGPAVGTAPHQPPSFPNGQPGGYGQQQPYQYGQQQPYGQYQGQPSYPQSGPPQRPPDNRPPKKKGNPIITRYPPPPGYRGPAQPQGPYPPNQYQPPPQGYPQNYAAPPNYPPQGYQAPTNYPPTPAYSPQSYGPPQNYPPQPNYSPQSQPPPQNYQYPQQGYQSAPGYSQPPNYPDVQGYAPPQSTYQGYPPQPAPANPNQQPYPQQHGWQPPSNQAPYPPHDPYGSYSGTQDPNATPTPSSAHPATAQQTPTSAHPESATSEKGEKPQLFLAWDDWDFDFDGAIWPKSNEPVDPNLSLGVIIWRPAKQVTRALPSTFDEAEEQALKPPAEKLGNGESVSIYFTTDNSHEAFLDVRQTDEWYMIKNDPIFVVFPEEKDMDLIPLEECIAKRDRPDEPWEEPNVDDDEDMRDPTWNVMDNLEQALSGQSDDAKPPATNKESEPHSSRDQRQEDLLAMLGVTGTPKPPSDEPMSFPFPAQESKPPASLPEKPPAPPVSQIPPRPEQPPQRAHSYGGHRNTNYGPPPPQRPYGSMSASDRRRPPPPPPPDSQEYDPWNPRTVQNPPNNLPNSRSVDGSRQSPARSEGSNHTLAGSDFEADKPNNGSNGAQASPTAPSSATTPSIQRGDSSFNRKRSYDDADHADGQTRQQGDHSKRKRRSEIESAYSRR